MLKLVFPRLYNLCQNKLVRVSDRGKWIEGEWRWKWKWRRNFFDREISSFNNLVDFVNRWSLKQDKEDQWLWTVSTDRRYNMKAVYNHLVKDSEDINKEEKTIFKAI